MVLLTLGQWARGGKEPQKSTNTTPKAGWMEYFFTVLFVVNQIVSLLFWGLYFYNQEIILPKAMEKYYPFHVNLFQHGIINVLSWGELLFHRQQGRLGLDILAVSGLTAAYIGLTAYIATFDSVSE